MSSTLASVRAIGDFSKRVTLKICNVERIGKGERAGRQSLDPAGGRLFGCVLPKFPQSAEVPSNVEAQPIASSSPGAPSFDLILRNRGKIYPF